jgi:hypothetical protein
MRRKVVRKLATMKRWEGAGSEEKTVTNNMVKDQNELGMMSRKVGGAAVRTRWNVGRRMTTVKR